VIKTKQDILNVLDQNQTHMKAPGVRRIGIFGSFVREEQCPESDIDMQRSSVLSCEALRSLLPGK
jgi:predicted nucleotidyltransferase